MSCSNNKQSDVENLEATSSRNLKEMFHEMDGFDDEDLEKPNFPGKQSSEKVPFVLSQPDEVPAVQVPATINQYLRKYQREGIAFLYRQYSCGKGAILADDMGLGKTVQVIGLISAVLGKTGTKLDIYGKYLERIDANQVSATHTRRENGAFLIVSPHSVLYNWNDELMTWGYFKIGKFHKNKRDETLERAAMNKLDVVLTTYETLRNHWESLNRLQWLALIMDEVHHLKDPKTAVTIASKSVKVKRRIGLTGTPLQNRLLDLWCVLDWANPGCLGEKDDFSHYFGKPITQGQRFDVTKRELATGRKKTQEFQTMLDAWCLRRTKSLISDQLPQKDQKVVFCPLSKLQEDIYKTLLQTSDVQLLLKQGEPCDCRSELSRGQCCYSVNQEGCTMKKLMLQYLKLLLKVSNHAALLLPQVKQTDPQRKRAAVICEKVFSAHPSFEVASKSPSFELFSDSEFCGKMKVLDKLLKLFQQKKDKVLLFSYSTQLLDMLESYIISCGIVYRRLDGRIRGEQRLRVVREFNTDPSIFVFLVSTKAGGVGLNLTSANVVIVFDPSWNPANDLQAEDRAYRIGQRRDVKVFRMISSGTVEENMYLRQVYKQQLANVAVEGSNERRYFNAVDGEKDKKGELFGIENLFALKSDGRCVSTDIFKRSDKIERGFRMAKYELLPQKKKTEAKIETTTVINEAEDEEEDQSYDLNEVTSQFIGDESTYSAVDLCGGKKRNHDKRTRHKLLPCGSDVVECSENCSGSLKKAGTETEANKYIDVKDAEAKNKINTKRSHLLHGEEKWKRRKNQMKLNPTKNEPPISGDSQVNQILVDCGIHHTHSNKLIIGPSKAENEMTSRAIKEVFDLGQGSQQPANCFAAIESDGEESDDISDYNQQGTATSGDTNRDSEKSDDKMAVSTGRDQKEMMVRKIGDTSVLFGETPKTIRLRQFSEIAQTRGYESEVDLAKAVVSSSVKERMNMLKDFYKTRDYDCNILSYFESVQASVETEDHTSGTKNKRLPRCDRTFTVFKPRHHRKKSYTKILQATLNKKNVLNKNSSKEGKNSLSSSGAQDRTCVLTKARSVDVANACFSVKRRAEYSETTGSSLLANEDVGSRNGFDIKCTDDNTGKPQTSDLRNNICLSSLADLPAVTSAIPAGPEHSQSSFLDEFLFECSQQNKISSERSRIDDNENVPDSARRASGKKFSSSVIDDLI